MDWLISCFVISFKVISFMTIFFLMTLVAVWIITLVFAIITALYKTFFEE